jgi:uncharacterized phiE125 gp8 family phage protein
MALWVRLKRATFLSSPYSNTGDFMSDDTSSSLRLVVPPMNEPLTLIQAKTFLRIEHNADDEPVTRAIMAARQAAEQHMRCALLPQTWEYTIANPQATCLRLPWGPAQSIVSIQLMTELGITSSMALADYKLSVDGCSVILSQRISIEKMTIRYVASTVASAAEIAAPILQGILHHMTVMLESRDGDEPLPMQAIACYAPYRRISL